MGERESQFDLERHAAPSSQVGRSLSGPDFPVVHLDTCIEIARVVSILGGRACAWDELAEAMGQSATGGRFRQKLSSARTFGLLEYGNGEVRLTSLAYRCIDYDTEKDGRVAAFLAVPLFNDLFATFSGRQMPAAEIIEDYLQALGVDRKRAPRARQAFVRSARDAGFFERAVGRMIKPTGAPYAIDAEAEATQAPPEEEEETPGRRRRLLLEGLLAQMPEPGTEWEATRCLAWLRTFVAGLAVVYTNLEELQAIEVRMRSDRDAS